MEIQANQVMMNLLTGKALQEADHASESKQALKDMTVGSALAAALLSPAPDSKSMEPADALTRYKLAQKFVTAISAKGEATKVEIDLSEATLLQGVSCAVYTSATVSGQLCEILNG